MSEFEDKSEALAGSSAAELQEEVHSLRMLLSVSLILMIVFGLSLDLFLLKQVSAVRGQLAADETLVNNFNAPKAIEFWNELVKYSRTHPDFAPVINKYSPALNQTLIGNPNAAK